MQHHLGLAPASPERKIDSATTQLVEQVEAPEIANDRFHTHDRISQEMHALSPENAEQLLQTLQARFEDPENLKRHPGIQWAQVQARLEANPEKLWSLNEMERTGGEPDVTGDDPQTKEYIFMDCSEESPIGRRDCVYNKVAQELARLYPDKPCNGNAVDMAAAMGVKLLTREEYLNKLQKLGNFDKKTVSWVETPIDEGAFGAALYGTRGGIGAYVLGSDARNHYCLRGFRASLKV